jgi:hypothetical protein
MINGSEPAMQRLAVLLCCGLLTAGPLAAGGASACTVCDGGAGRQVRAGIIDGDLAMNLFATLLPFAVLLCVVAAIHFGWRPMRKRVIPAPEDANGD